jgi:hypothetical protein
MTKEARLVERERSQPYNFAAPDDELDLSQAEPILGALLSTKAVRRLEQIRFLGGIDYFLVSSPNGAEGSCL